VSDYTRKWDPKTHPANAKLDDHHFAGTTPTNAEVVAAWLETQCMDGRTMYAGRWPKWDEAIAARLRELEANLEHLRTFGRAMLDAAYAERDAAYAKGIEEGIERVRETVTKKHTWSVRDTVRVACNRAIAAFRKEQTDGA
jgi:hypothetical protein